MTNPYQPSSSLVSDTEKKMLRISHSLVALFSPMFLMPGVLYGAVHMLFPEEQLAFGNAWFWVSLLIGGALSSISVLPFKNLPLWVAATIGSVIGVVTLFVAVLIGSV